MTRQRKRRLLLPALLAVTGLLLAGCGDDDDSDAGTGGDGDTETAGAGQDGGGGGDLTIAVVTHGDGGSFWAVAKKGAEDAGRDLGVTVEYSESNNDPEEQAQLIEAAVTAEVDGLAVSAPNPDAIADAVEQAVDAGIPVITLNSGADQFADLGAITHVGQTETVAGEGAGEKLAEAGATKLLCVVHEQGNIGLEQRCEGAADTFGGDVENFQVTGTSDIQTTLNEIQSKLQGDTSIDSVLALNPDIAIAARDAIAGADSEAQLATFDLSGDVVTAIQDGEILFAVDQQQYLQGYLPVVFLSLYNTNANTVGGGLPVLTGPGFVTADNAEQVADLAEAGTR
jgi:simple sugar transport system substrate-binding protein